MSTMDKDHAEDTMAEIVPQMNSRPNLGPRGSAKSNSLRLDLPEPIFTSTIDSDHADSDHEDGHLQEEEAQTVVAVSIGKEQTRLKSPTTPAAEKAAALDANGWGFFDGTVDDEEEDAPRSGPIDHPHRESERSSPATAQGFWEQANLGLPSPWISAPKVFEEPTEKRQGLIGRTNRSRAQTGPTGMLADLNIKRFWSSFSGFGGEQKGFKDLQLPRIGSILSGGKDGGQSSGSRSNRSNSLFTPRFFWNNSSQNSKSQRSRDVSPIPSLEDVQVRKDPSPPRPSPSPIQKEQRSRMNDDYNRTTTFNEVSVPQQNLPQLRRATSEASLPLTSTLSIVSSLGDDSRWENVQEQVNSRMKAIKDTLQDSSIKLPSIPSINLSALRPDFTLTHRRSISTPKNTAQAAMSSVREDAENFQRRSQGSDAALKTKLVQKSPKSTTFLDDALERLTGDVVVMGGYRGSILRQAGPPPNRQVWVPVKVGLNIRKVNLEVGLDPQDEEEMENHIFPSGMLTHIGPVDISRRLLKRLRNCKNAQEGKLRVHDYGYDWRLSPHLLSRRLMKFMESLECNSPGTNPRERGATVIAHSLGGLITRHAVNQRPELFAGVVYAGVPQHCVNILGPFRNGDEVLLSSRVLTAQVNFTLRTSFVLLPESGQCFIDKNTKEEYHVNFFDVEAWKEYAFSPCIAPYLPALSQPERRGILGSISGSLPSLTPKGPSSGTTTPRQSISAAASTVADTVATKAYDATNPETLSVNPQMGSHSSSSSSPNLSSSTIPLPAALTYLARTLASTLRFKRDLAFQPAHAARNAYPPIAIIYSTSIPTVYGAKVVGRDGIRRADAYDNLAFASGDGVVLARAAMVPRGYKVVEGGRVRTERGHVGLLGDLEAVGRCLAAVRRGREGGVGLCVGIGVGKGEGEEEGKGY